MGMWLLLKGLRSGCESHVTLVLFEDNKLGDPFAGIDSGWKFIAAADGVSGVLVDDARQAALIVLGVAEELIARVPRPRDQGEGLGFGTFDFDVDLDPPRLSFMGADVGYKALDTRAVRVRQFGVRYYNRRRSGKGRVGN